MELPMGTHQTAKGSDVSNYKKQLELDSDTTIQMETQQKMDEQ
jgi:hypothetical protein